MKHKSINLIPELLAPAGDLEKLKVAFMYGADAVYAGIPDFGMRVRQIGFDFDSLAEGVEYAHKIGKKLFVTVNIFAHNEDIKGVSKYLKKLADIGPDALIVADPGILAIIKENKIDIPLHLSTQANVTNWSAVRFWASQGFERIILARELSEKEISEIVCNNPTTNIEMFIHGAICMSYSGRCNISNYLSGRDANKGDCSHCCRWKYNIYLEESQRPGELMKVEEDEHGCYFFNSKDLCLMPVLDKVLKTKVMSLKIEGRNKSIFYIATVVRAYREALDMIIKGQYYFKKNKAKLMRELESVNTRGYTYGFFDGCQADVSAIKRHENKNGNRKFVGLITNFKDGLVRVVAKNQIRVSDDLELLTKDGVKKIKIKKFIDEDGKEITSGIVNTNAIFYFKSKKSIHNYAMLRKIVKIN